MPLPSSNFSMSISLAAALAAIFFFGQAASQTTNEVTEDETLIPFALPQSGPFTPAEIEIGNDKAITDWFRSAHANAASEAFSHWDDDGEVSASCATCHSGEGFRDFHGLDGTEAGVVNGTIDVGGVVDCGTCLGPVQAVKIAKAFA